MICPNCNADDEPAAQAGVMAVCANCGCSVRAYPDGTYRRATGEDAALLTSTDLQLLQMARGKIVRPRRRET